MLNDFIEYWSAAKVLLTGGNPYSPAELLARQQALGWSQPEALLMWNPPWTLSYIVPFGFVDYQNAQFAWFLSHTLIIFVGAKLLWRTYGGDPAKSRYAAISVLSFAPTYFALLLGQIGPLILLGLIGFVAQMKKKAPGYAGAVLALATIKPHLLHLLWLALLLWTVKNREWQLAKGYLLSAMMAAAFPLMLDQEVYFEYVELLKTAHIVRPLDWATPSLGTAIAELFAFSDVWIRWLPSLVGAIWLLWYWSRHSQRWDWTLELPLILLVSVVTASFVWTFDHIVILPAVVQGAVWASQSETAKKRAILIGLYIGTAVIVLTCKWFVLNDFWYFWTGPSYLLLYLYARRNFQQNLRCP